MDQTWSYTPARAENTPTVAPTMDYGFVHPAQVVFAGFWGRVFASFIDGVLVVAVSAGLAMAFVWYVGQDTARANDHTLMTVFRILVIVVGWIYSASLESGPAQATLGKRMMGIKVTDLSGNPISFLRGTGRHFGKILSQLTGTIGYLMMKFTSNHQCLHDMVSGCLVVSTLWD